MLRHAAPHGYGQPSPLGDEAKDLVARELEGLFQLVTATGPRNDRVAGGDLSGSVTQRRVKAESARPAFESHVGKETLGPERDQRLDSVDRSARSAPTGSCFRIR